MSDPQGDTISRLVSRLVQEVSHDTWQANRNSIPREQLQGILAHWCATHRDKIRRWNSVNTLEDSLTKALKRRANRAVSDFKASQGDQYYYSLALLAELVSAALWRSEAPCGAPEDWLAMRADVQRALSRCDPEHDYWLLQTLGSATGGIRGVARAHKCSTQYVYDRQRKALEHLASFLGGTGGS